MSKVYAPNSMVILSSEDRKVLCIDRSFIPDLRHVKDEKIFDDAKTIEKQACKLSAKLPRGWPIGLEKKLAASLANQPPPDLPDEMYDILNIFSLDGLPDIKQFQYRPASEYAAISIWAKVEKGKLTLEDTLEMERLLTGHQSGLRRRPIHTTKNAEGIRVRYPAHPSIRDDINGIVSEVNKRHSRPLLAAINIMTTCMTLLPLYEGNGRLARLLFQASLLRNGVISKPIMPLGPIMYVFAQEHVNALHTYEFRSDGKGLLRLLLWFSQQTCALLRKL